MKFVFNSGLSLVINKNCIQDIDDDNDAFLYRR